LGFFGRFFRLVKRLIITGVVLIIGFYIVKNSVIKNADDDIKSENSQKTEQVSKKQSTTTAKSTGTSNASSKSAPSKTATTTSSSKPTTPQSSNSQSSSNSSSKTPSTAQTNTAATSASMATTKSTATESEASYQTYLALSTLLESEGKSLKLCEAQNQTKGQEANVIGKMSQLYGTKYYGNALKDLVRYCPKYASEYSKNGKYFASEAEFYRAYIAPDYSKQLKAKKKER
jgi:cytoskeletal protein RodZ